MNSPVDPALLQLVQQELKTLQDAVENMSAESEEEKTKVQHELQNVAATLEEMKHRLEMVQQNVELLYNCIGPIKGRVDNIEDRMDDFEGTNVQTNIIIVCVSTIGRVTAS